MSGLRIVIILGKANRRMLSHALVYQLLLLCFADFVVHSGCWLGSRCQWLREGGRSVPPDLVGTLRWLLRCQPSLPMRLSLDLLNLL
jgi:hypothetical protein